MSWASARVPGASARALRGSSARSRGSSADSKPRPAPGCAPRVPRGRSPGLRLRSRCPCGAWRTAASAWSVRLPQDAARRSARAARAAVPEDRVASTCLRPARWVVAVARRLVAVPRALLRDCSTTPAGPTTARPRFHRPHSPSRPRRARRSAYRDPCCDTIVVVAMHVNGVGAVRAGNGRPPASRRPRSASHKLRFDQLDPLPGTGLEAARQAEQGAKRGR